MSVRTRGSTPICRWGVPPSGPHRGHPHPFQWWYSHPSWWRYPHPSQWGGWGGTSSVRTGWGYPLVRTEWGYIPCQDWIGVSPSQDWMPPISRQSSRASTCYAAAVCLLCSRRTLMLFLFGNEFNFCIPTTIRHKKDDLLQWTTSFSDQIFSLQHHNILCFKCL